MNNPLARAGMPSLAKKDQRQQHSNYLHARARAAILQYPIIEINNSVAFNIKSEASKPTFGSEEMI